MSEAAVVVTEWEAAERRIGVLTLNVPKTLNSLTLEMVDLIQAALDGWRDDPDIAAVLIASNSEKAFCAGGDVQALHASAVATPGGPCEYAETFFAREYRMNYALHTFDKPILCWGHGIVMGGGLGIMAGCSHRVVTETTRIAMPEITIALFPDVGGSWFLNHMPGRAGRFLALTGASINAADALYTGLADRFLGSDQWQTLIDALRALRWSEEPKTNHGLLRNVLRPLEQKSLERLPAAQVEPHMAILNQLCDGDSVHEVIDSICGLDTEDRWLQRARDGLAAGSPLAALWIDRQLETTRLMSLREVFQAEIQLATNVVRHPEFAEGVRALLIDKDRQPNWTYKSSREVPEAVLDEFFAAPWPANPLADL
jgi:enoyl-CoA hydratase/carnithine racemase